MVVACEPSGDMQAGALVHALHQRMPDLEVFAVGGRRLSQERAEFLYDSSTWGTVGAWQAFPKAPAIFRAFQGIKRRMLAVQPDMLLVVDSPAINLPLVKFARRHGIRTAYYFPPSQWASNLERHRYISSLVDDVIVAFRYTADRYREAGLSPAYFGHPLVDMLTQLPPREECRRQLGVPLEGDLVGLLPGSRTQEIESLLPIFLTAAARIPNAHFVVPVATPALAPRIQRLVGAHPGLPVTVVDGQSRLVMAAADARIRCSGTATLEAAVLGVPSIICYRLPWPDYIVGWLLGIRVKWIGLPNLVMQETIVPEVIQGDVNPERLSAEVTGFLRDPDRRRKLEEKLAAVKKHLGTPGVTAAVADFIVERLALGPTRHRHHHE